MSEPEPVFLVDRDLGSKVVPDALRKAGCTVEVHSDHFDGEAPDHEWIRTVGERGWFVITHDDKIRYPIGDSWRILAPAGMSTKRGEAQTA